MAETCMLRRVDFRNWYENNAHRLTGSGLWLRGGELNTLAPDEYCRRDFRFLLTRLSTYFDTGYSFTHSYLYEIASAVEGVYPDLAYLPPKFDVPVFEADGIPWFLGTQSKKGPLGFDLIGISNSIVQELLNLPSFLKRSGIPLRKSKRMASAQIPLLLLGGANALYTSVIWESDPMVDAVFVGESDEAIREILIRCRDGKRRNRSKREILDSLADIPGFLEPDAVRPTKKAFVWSLNKSQAHEHGPIPFLEDHLGKAHLQISEGCPCFCSFCAESWDRKPYREKDVERLVSQALTMKAEMGLDTVELYSFNFNMYSGFYPLLWELVPLFNRIGLKSQRFDLLARDPQMIEFQHAIEKATLTCGLEGISPRLRKYLHKNLEDIDLHRSLEAIFRSRARELKVFLIATGLEEEQDFEALKDLLIHMKKIQGQLRVNTRVVFSMTPLVRFPWTPLEFEDAYETDHLQRIINQAKTVVGRSGFEFRESADLPEYWVSQFMIRSSHPQHIEVLREALEETSYVYFRAIPQELVDKIQQKLRERGLLEGLFKGYSLEESYSKPWARVETGVKRDFLWQEVLRARSYKEIDYCLGRSWTEARCFLCGGCPSAEHILDIVKAKQPRDYSLDQFVTRVRDERKNTRSVFVRMHVGKRGRGIPRRAVATALARALMKSSPEVTRAYRGYVNSHWTGRQNLCWILGDDIFEFRFDAKGLEALRCIESSQVDSHLGEWGRFLGFDSTPPKRIRVYGEFEFKPEDFLMGRGLKYTLRKTPDQRYEYGFSAQALKKGFLESLSNRRSLDPTDNDVELEAGPKFNVEEFLPLAIHPTATWERVYIESR